MHKLYYLLKMASSKSKLFDQIDNKAKVLINGYMREIQQLFNNQNVSYYVIPIDINRICFMFYYIFEQFDENRCGEEISITNNNKTIDNKSGGKGTCFGKCVISSILDNIYIWKIKTIGTSTSCISIGIADAESLWFNDHSDLVENTISYGYAVCDAALVYCSKDASTNKDIPAFTKKGDVLTMKLKFNPNKSTLSFRINNDDEFIAFDNVERAKELKYRLAISMWDRRSAVELIEFNTV